MLSGSLQGAGFTGFDLFVVPPVKEDSPVQSEQVTRYHVIINPPAQTSHDTHWLFPRCSAVLFFLSPCVCSHFLT